MILPEQSAGWVIESLVLLKEFSDTIKSDKHVLKSVVEKIGSPQRVQYQPTDIMSYTYEYFKCIKVDKG